MLGNFTQCAGCCSSFMHVTYYYMHLEQHNQITIPGTRSTSKSSKPVMPQEELPSICPMCRIPFTRHLYISRTLSICRTLIESINFTLQIGIDIPVVSTRQEAWPTVTKVTTISEHLEFFVAEKIHFSSGTFLSPMEPLNVWSKRKIGICKIK